MEERKTERGKSRKKYSEKERKKEIRRERKRERRRERKREEEGKKERKTLLMLGCGGFASAIFALAPFSRDCSFCVLHFRLWCSFARAAVSFSTKKGQNNNF